MNVKELKSLLKKTPRQVYAENIDKECPVSNSIDKKCPVSNCNSRVELKNNRCCDKCEEHLLG